MTRAIRGARVVTEDAERDADVLIEGDRIAALVPAGSSRADEVIDARGLVAMPGVVDAHVHCNEPGRTRWEGFAAATRGAAAGGTTTVCDMPLNSIPPTVDAASFDAKRAALERSAVIDVALWGGAIDDDAAAMSELRDRGAVGAKAFMSDSGVPEFPALDDDALRRVLANAASLGVLVAVHAEDEATTRDRAAALRAAGRADPDAWLESRPPEAEVAAARRLLALAGETGARVHVLHASAAAVVDDVAAARRRGVDATVETCPHYLVFDDADVRRLGSLLKCAPPIRERTNRDRLWRLVAAREIDLLASDHSPCSADLKATADIWRAWGGVTGVQTLLASLLEATHTGALALREIPRLVSGAPARRLGLYPRKGSLRPGADADLVLVDLGRGWTLERSELQARSGLSAHVGRRFRGRVVRTIVRGRDVYRDGEIVAEPGYGRFVPATGASVR